MDFPKDNKPSPEDMVRVYEETCAKVWKRQRRKYMPAALQLTLAFRLSRPKKSLRNLKVFLESCLCYQIPILIQ